MTEQTLEDLREQIRRIDLELVARAAERVDLARQVGELKRRQRLSTADYAQERTVLERAREAARERGLDPVVAEDLVARLIRAAVTVQEEDSLRLAALGAGKSAVIVGGAGRMGRWLGRFLAAQGFTTAALDPAAAPEEDAWARRALPQAELVVCAAPPATIAELYMEWCRQTAGRRGGRHRQHQDAPHRADPLRSSAPAAASPPSIPCSARPPSCCAMPTS